MKTKIKFTLLSVILALTLMSCNKSYKYIEITEEKGLFGETEIKEKKAETIKANSDSAAYLKAFEKFCISVKVNNDMKMSLGSTISTPKRFKLLNDKDQDIAYITFFSTKDEKEKEILKRVFSLSNTIKESSEETKKEKTINSEIDSSKIKSLKSFFTISKDEFSKSKRLWYKPKNAAYYTNVNAFYCYFQVEDGIASNLRLVMQYAASDWLFIKDVQFSIDGNAYDYFPSKVERDSGASGIWEWFDECLINSDKELIYALSKAKNAKMKLNGSQYSQVRNITKAQINSIKNTLEMYNAMGGAY